MITTRATSSRLHVAPARPADESWTPPPATDALGQEPVRLDGDGVVAVLGLHRLEAVEEAVRSTPPGTAVTAAVVTGDPDELLPLARLTLARLCDGLRRAFPLQAWPRLRIVVDGGDRVAAAAGVAHVADTTEAAVRIEAGRIVARASGRGACHAAATADQRVS